MNKELGDFQTPPQLIKQILQILDEHEKTWTRLLEPTCGIGNFIRGAMQHNSFSWREIKGIEIQAQHISQAASIGNGDDRLKAKNHIELINRNIFSLDLSQDLIWQTEGPLLVLGNPPWITNSILGILNSDNLPQKRNIKGLTGLDALTGASNFDIAESIILKLILELSKESPSIAVLCKTSVARNVLLFAANQHLPIKKAYLRRVDAKKWFDAAVDACLFYVDVEMGWAKYDAPVYATLDARTPETIIGIHDGRLVADIDNYKSSCFLDGKSPINWRQGLKHDAASVMELRFNSGRWINKLGEAVTIERERIFPLLKGSDIYHGRTQELAKGVIVTQKNLGEATLRLSDEAPLLWQYLQQHKAIFAKRKSSIYRNRPEFSIFGVGDYTFAPYKVAISGLHKSPEFRLITPIENQPVLLDDTCYFVPCNSLTQAALLTVLLQHTTTQAFLKAVSFSDSKRPITKKVLQRVDLAQLLDQIETTQVIELASKLSTDLEGCEISYDDWMSAIDSIFTPYSKNPLLI